MQIANCIARAQSSAVHCSRMQSNFTTCSLLARFARSCKKTKRKIEREKPQCYIVFREMEDMKKNDDPHATVCPELSNHEVRDMQRQEGERERERDAQMQREICRETCRETALG